MATAAWNLGESVLENGDVFTFTAELVASGACGRIYDVYMNGADFPAPERIGYAISRRDVLNVVEHADCELRHPGAR